MKQLTSTYKFKPFTWSDGTPGSVDDLLLGHKIDCDKDSGSTSFEVCDQIAEVTPGTGDGCLEYTIKWLPGSQYSLYFRLAVPHLSEPPGAGRRPQAGRRAGERMGHPARDRRAAAEHGSVRARADWNKGESMTFVRNEYFEPKAEAEDAS